MKYIMKYLKITEKDKIDIINGYHINLTLQTKLNCRLRNKYGNTILIDAAFLLPTNKQNKRIYYFSNSKQKDKKIKYINKILLDLINKELDKNNSISKEDFLDFCNKILNTKYKRIQSNMFTCDSIPLLLFNKKAVLIDFSEKLRKKINKDDYFFLTYITSNTYRYFNIIFISKIPNTIDQARIFMKSTFNLIHYQRYLKTEIVKNSLVGSTYQGKLYILHYKVDRKYIDNMQALLKIS